MAASDLVIDPKHASWVKKHWGTNYLHRENVFYRMLVIAALTSREKMLHDGAHLDALRDQVETFSKELDDSKSGLLNDYPGECYPGDVMAAIMCIRRADARESAILWLLSVQPEKRLPIYHTGGASHHFVYVVSMGALLFGIWRMVAAIKVFRVSLREPESIVSAPMFQCLIWAGLIISAIAATCLGRDLPGLALLLAALLIPRRKKCITDEKGTNGDQDTSRN